MSFASASFSMMLVTFSRSSLVLPNSKVEQHLDHLLQRSVVLLQRQHLGESCLAAMDVRKIPSLCLWFVFKIAFRHT